MLTPDLSIAFSVRKPEVTFLTQNMMLCHFIGLGLLAYTVTVRSSLPQNVNLFP